MDFLNNTNISYVTKVIKTSSELNDDLLEILKKDFNEGAIDAPFCNSGDYDLDDLRDDIPSGWNLTEENLINPGEALIVLAKIDYSAERDIAFDSFDEVELVAFDLGGIYPLSVISEEDPFETDSRTFENDMTIMFRVCYADGEFDNDECEIDEFSEKCSEWKEWLEITPFDRQERT